jgi:AcrR family transcriptional regulator
MASHPDPQHTDARQRLVRAALQVFASKGYEGASTREICRLAEVNVAAIHYYFGDKASLYREVFRIPERLGQFPAEMDDQALPLRAVLVAFYGHIMAYIAAPELQQLRLVVLREELQPSGALDGETDGPRRVHDHLTDFLCRSIGIRDADTAIHHLAFSIGGLALVLFVHRTAVNSIAPELLADDAALHATIERLADHGVALIEAEAARRGVTIDRESGTSRATQMKLTGAAHLKRAAERS